MDEGVRRALIEARCSAPHDVLGAHPGVFEEREGVWIRVFQPHAARVEALLEGGPEVQLEGLGEGVFEGFVVGAGVPLRYRLRLGDGEGGSWERGDPYRFWPTVGEGELVEWSEGRQARPWEVLGARVREVDGVEGVSVSVWAPNARRVSVVCEACSWDGRVWPMRSLGSSGVWELFLPDLGEGDLYKFEVLGADGSLKTKADPMARRAQLPPETASVVERSRYVWSDGGYWEERAGRDPACGPMSIYEVHLGSWQRDGERILSYEEVAERLVEHVGRFGFTHVELLPVSEHPFTGSWGYQVTGYYAPTARYGTPDQLRALVDRLHGAGVGVILDWVPAHFPKDEWALRRFDGTALYEHEDPRRGEHPDWGTQVFNFGRTEVKNFLIGNARYWFEEFHVDGLRVDAVASMLYLDYSREEGQWLPNVHGGRENLEAIALFRELNAMVEGEFPGRFTVAEESTSWPGVTRAVAEGGLGFTFKWNMGWMHDTLRYFARDPLYRLHHQDELTFAQHYEYDEQFVMPLSHDEVVHEKGSLLTKMAGDPWQRRANLRALLGYQYTRPGKQLVFMGVELASEREWDHDRALAWERWEDPDLAAHARFLEDLGGLYRGSPCLWERDHSLDGFQWVDCTDHERSVLSYLRRGVRGHALVVLNLTPVPQDHYRVGVPGGRYRKRLDSDALRYGGSGREAAEVVEAEAVAWQQQPQSLVLDLPPLSVLVYMPDDQ